MSDQIQTEIPSIDRTIFETEVETLRPHAGEICLLYHTDLVRLHGVATDDEDIYFIVEGLGDLGPVWASAAGAITPLRAIMPEDIYARMDNCFTLSGVSARDFEVSIQERCTLVETNMSDAEVETMLDILASRLDPDRPIEARRALCGMRNAEPAAQTRMTRGMIALMGGLSLQDGGLDRAIARLVEEGHLKPEGLVEIETWSLQRPESQPEFA